MCTFLLIIIIIAVDEGERYYSCTVHEVVTVLYAMQFRLRQCNIDLGKVLCPAVLVKTRVCGGCSVSQNLPLVALTLYCLRFHGLDDILEWRSTVLPRSYVFSFSRPGTFIYFVTLVQG